MYVIEDNRVFTALIVIAILLIIFGIIRAVFRIIKYIFASIWCLLTGKKRKRYDPVNSDDWLTRAQARQEIRFQNSLPPLLSEMRPQKKTWKQRRNERKGKSANGWIFNEETQLWELPQKKKQPVHQFKPEINEKFENNPDWYWDEEKGMWRYKAKH